MEIAKPIKTQNTTYTMKDAMNVIFTKLDEAIDDLENGRVQSIDEAWEEIDAI